MNLFYTNLLPYIRVCCLLMVVALGVFVGFGVLVLVGVLVKVGVFVGGIGVFVGGIGVWVAVAALVAVGITVGAVVCLWLGSGLRLVVFRRKRYPTQKRAEQRGTDELS